jgi:hypothetical protein
MIFKKKNKTCFLCTCSLGDDYIELVYKHLSEDGTTTESSTLFLCESCSAEIEKEQDEFLEDMGENAREQNIKEQ